MLKIVFYDMKFKIFWGRMPPDPLLAPLKKWAYGPPGGGGIPIYYLYSIVKAFVLGPS